MLSLPRRLPFGLVVAVLLAVASMPAAAQWKWRDASGRVTVSDMPPPASVPDRDILRRPPGAAPSVSVVETSTGVAAPQSAASAAVAMPSASAPQHDPALEARRKQAELDKQQKEKAEADRLAAQRADNCRRARSHLATLDSGVRMVRTNEKNEREILNDAQRADEVRRTRAVIDSDCR
jgi:hypothetical protein